MKTTIKFVALAAMLFGCGDNKTVPDAMPRRDSSGPDAQCSNCPAAPVLGTTQLDRMGRPAINTALNNAFNTDATAAGTAKDAYNADTSIATWQQSYVPRFMGALGVLDALDTGMCGNGICEAGEVGAGATGTVCADCAALQVGTVNGCGNQVLYTNPTAATSYQALGGVLANDELYLDTSKTICAFYLAVEFGVALPQVGNSTCGGRAPQYDVIDFTYSALAMGISGFSTDGTFTPQLKDDVPPHSDYLSAFPYLGPPHP